MKKSLAIASSLAVIVLTGCSSQTDRKTASGSYKYLETQEQAPLKVPESLDAPAFSREFALPELGDNVDPDLVGKKMVVQSPSLVLPLVTGSSVQEGKSTATITFDQVDDSQPLSQAIWNSLLSFLDEEGIGVNSFDAEKQVLITDWMVITKEIEGPWYSMTSSESEVGRRFEFSLAVKPHGRSAALTVDLKDYLETQGNEVIAEVSSMKERREEVDVLNQVIVHYEYQVQLAKSRRVAQIRQGLQTEMGFNADGDPAFIVASQYDIAWPRMLLVLRKLGFDVKDLDKSNGLLFVSYNGADNSWWDGLFSGEGDLLKKDDYRLKVEAAGKDLTSVTFMNNESVPFEANQVSDLYSAFAEVMSEDNLDI